MDEALTIGVRRERDYAIVTAAGEIDIATGAGLRERLSELAASGRPLVVELDLWGPENTIPGVRGQLERRSVTGSGCAVVLVDGCRVCYSLFVAGRRGQARRRARRQPARGLRPAAGKAAVPPDRAGPPDTAGPHPGRGPGSPDSGPDHTRLSIGSSSSQWGVLPGRQGLTDARRAVAQADVSCLQAVS